MQNNIQDVLVAHLPSDKRSSPSEWTSFSGPCCVHNGERRADTKGRAGTIMNGDGSASYHCFNCGFKTGWAPGLPVGFKFRQLLEWLGAEEAEIRGLVIEALRIKQDYEILNPVKEVKEEVVFKTRQLPQDSKSIMDWLHDGTQDFANRTAEYAISRGLEDNLDKLMWSPSRAANMNRRLIITFNWKGQTIGFCGRAIDQDVSPKYFNAMEPGYVYNTEAQDKENKFVIVVEGPFDALKIGGVAVLSNTISETQADIIDNLAKEVIVVPDKDEAGKKLVDAALQYRWNVAYPDWDDDVKDVSDAIDKYGKLYTLWSIVNTKQSSRIKIELMRKKLGN